MASIGSLITRRNLRDLSDEYQPPACSLGGARLIEPVTQGDYDGLCGLYCIINGIRLVLAPHTKLRHEEVRALFKAGVRFLEREGSLSAAVHSCIGKQAWPALAEFVVATAQPMAGRPIILERPGLRKEAPIAETLRRIERMIMSGRAPCVFFRGRYRHYSVISGYTPASVKLFDSFGYHRVLRKSCGTGGTSTSTHRLHLRSIIALAVG